MRRTLSAIRETLQIPPDLKAQGIQEASAWCERSRTKVRVLDVKETQARPLGGWPEAEVFFKCE